MSKRVFRLLTILGFLGVALVIVSGAVMSQTTVNLKACEELAFSTEEDFITQGPMPPDGALISDGDLLGRNHTVCMRNQALLQKWDIQTDLGLDAVDVLDVERQLVAFSTSLDDPGRRFTQGDLLTTWGATVPNQILLILFQIQGDRGLDAVHFVGPRESIISFNDLISKVSRDEWLREPGRFGTSLRRYGIDLWISIEGTELRAATQSILDGDLLSVGYGVIVASNDALLPATVPAGIPNRGVDFGLDAFTASRQFNPEKLEPLRGHFSTEILYDGENPFTDGDVIRFANGIAIKDSTLVIPFEPMADFLGTDALYMLLDEPVTVRPDDYLPYILRFFRLQ